ncbi:MAG: class I SAM-dependent methyltransferase [Clostridiales bacterium]|nr:class I SAM-dependent methyltransferase [Clostridiales bacterium]
MSHYFIEDRGLLHRPRYVTYNFAGIDFVFETDSGLFSKDHIDPASDILIRALPPLSGSLLDLCCGYGCIGIVLAKAYSLRLTQSDINEAALRLTRKNCEAAGVESVIIKSDCFENIRGLFDTITLNPPIHAGKAVVYRMFEESAEHLVEGGRLFVVTLKKHGAESTKKSCLRYSEIVIHL